MRSGVPALAHRAVFRQGERVRGMELDPTHAALDLSEICAATCRIVERGRAHALLLYVHGNSICELAGIDRPVREKFRPNAALRAGMRALLGRLRAARMARACSNADVPSTSRNHGCSVCEGEAFRMIVTPFDVLVPRRDSADA